MIQATGNTFFRRPCRTDKLYAQTRQTVPAPFAKFYL